MWQLLWPELADDQVPIGHITNGVHTRSWLAPEMHDLYDRHFTPHWPLKQCSPDTWRNIDQVEDAELWETHRLLKVRLVAFVRNRLVRQLQRRNVSYDEIQEATRILNCEHLLIGFARRFATYKRADLLFRNLERLAALVDNPVHPIQLILAGKAHPQDTGGKELIHEIIETLSREPFKGKVLFLEGHDINVGRHLVQGVDVWLNTPRRPSEACGTSGQKCLLNGVLNLSILDGWWPEAYDGRNGFAIGDGGAHVDPDVQDERDMESLFHVLENEVIPLYYDRDEDGIPRRWIRRMKRAIRTLGWKFNTDRMVMDYARTAYLRAAGAQLENPRRW
jgi:starch phosphorylase